MNRELVLDAARWRVAEFGIPDPADYADQRVIIGFTGTTPVRAPAGTWLRLCEAVDRAARLDAGADLDDFLDVPSLRIPHQQARDELHAEFHTDIDEAVAAVLAEVPAHR